MNTTTTRHRGREQKKKGKVLLLLCIFFFGFLFLSFGKYIPTLWQLFFHKEIALKKTTDQRINILLLGIGGGKHDGPNLTDTILLTSIDPKTNRISLISLPRDLWAPELKAKINTAYAYGEEKQKGGGITLVRGIIEHVTGQQIDYVIRLDFNGFVRAVDMIGGLAITVDRSFDDYEYPIVSKENDPCDNKEEDLEKLATASSQLEAFPCRYEHLHFDKGEQHMDGITALKFVRSRHALGPEGTDFARSKRQEKIISAFKEKVFSAGTFLNPVKVVSLYDILKDSIDTDIKTDEYDDFIKLAKKMKGATTQSVVIDFGDEETKRAGLLINPPISEEYRGQWVIIPRIGNGNYAEIQTYIACEIKTGDCSITPTSSSGN